MYVPTIIRKLSKWAISYLRVIALQGSYLKSLTIDKGKPLFLGSGSRLDIALNGHCRIGKGVYISPNCTIQVMEGGYLTIGDDVYFNEGCRIVVAESVNIGSYTLFGPDVKIYDHDHAFDKNGVGHELISGSISIGERSWICANAVITRGVKIVDRTLIAAGSVVTSSCLEENSLYAGVPARFIKKLDLEATQNNGWEAG